MIRLSLYGLPSLESSRSAIAWVLNLARKAHQHSWWIVHTRPTRDATSRASWFHSARQLARELARGVKQERDSRFPSRLNMKHPPTALVGLRRENFQLQPSKLCQ